MFSIVASHVAGGFLRRTMVVIIVTMMATQAMGHCPLKGRVRDARYHLRRVVHIGRNMSAEDDGREIASDGTRREDASYAGLQPPPGTRAMIL